MVEINIKQDTPSLAERRAAQKQRQLVTKMIGVATLAVLAVVGAIIASQMASTPEASPVVDDTSTQPPKVNSNPSSETPLATGDGPSRPDLSEPLLIDDNGEAMWVSPTQGAPLTLNYLPAESQVILVVRPADLQSTGEWERIVASLGPRGTPTIEALEQAVGRRWDAIDQLVVSFHLAPDYSPQLVLVVKARGAFNKPGTLPGLAVWIPDPATPEYVVAAPAMIEHLQQSSSGRAVLRREFEELLSKSDNTRHVNLLVANSVVGSPAIPLWQGQFARLRSAIFNWLPDETQAFALSLHWNESFFAELRTIATLDQRPEKFAEQLRAKITDWPAKAEEQITSLTLQPHGRKLIARLPAMLRELVRYVRADRDDRFGLLRCYLPRPAGHNLIMAAELLLAEEYAGPAASVTTSVATAPTSLAERLQATTSLSFARDTLETALQMLSDDTGIPIELVGADLQLDGITKNQSFGLDMKNRTAAEILVEILRQANPDKTATGPADPKQKLVYVIVNGEQGQQSIKVTTRSQAEKRGETLPRVFVQ